MSRPSISVVTPCLNAAATIEQTLASVQAQDYESLEHIVVDGGSTDGTVELLERAEGVRYVSEPDRGLSHAVNKAVAMAQGEVIGWLNADDLYLPGALAHVGSAFARSSDVLWVTGPCVIVDGEGREIRRLVTAYKNLFLRHYSFRLHLIQNFVSAPCTFVRRRALQELDGLDERFQYSMDYDLWLRLGRQAPPVVLPEPLAAFRMAGETLSMRGFERQFFEHAQNAREHGESYPLTVTLNGLASRMITLSYRIMRRTRATS